MPGLTELAVRNAKPPESGAVTHWDSLKGFGLRVSSGGTKTFIVLIGSGRRQSIGRYPLVSLADARTEARRVLAEKQLGQVRPTFTAFDEAKGQFLRECEQRIKPRTLLDYRRLLGTHLPYGRQALGDVTPRELVRRFNTLNHTPTEKHHAFTVAKVFFSWCVKQHLIERSPMETLAVPAKPKARERVLSDEELKAVYEATGSLRTSFHAIVRLLILTGQRRGEIGALEWSWIAADTITLPDPKNGRPHTFPIGPEAQAVLAALPRLSDTYVFPAARDRVKGKPTTTFAGWSKAKAAFDAELADHRLAPWTLHDLRRTFSSGMAALQVRETVTEKLLNHISGGTQNPIARTYNKYKYLVEMREAILLWEAHLVRLVSVR